MSNEPYLDITRLIRERELRASVSAPTTTTLVTVPNVPLAETGIEYPASTGPVTLTEDDLRDMVESQGDPGIVSPRLKLGHSDPRFNGEVLDGEPAFGTAQNLRLENSGQTVVADFVGVPSWLANILPTAYPNRSIEGNFDVHTATGHSWRFVCTDVALLGVIWPGISTLDDLQTAFSESGPEGVELTASISASTNMEDVRRSFYDDVATEDSGRFWWWVRAALLDPNELIVDDDEGGLYRVPFSVSGDEVTFSDPIPVKIEYVDAPVAAARVLASTYQTSRDSRPADRQEGKVTPVDLDLLRTRLGLPEDADEEQINAALDEPEPDPAPGDGEEESEEEESEEEETEQTSPEGAVLVDASTMASLQHDAALGRQAYELEQRRDRDAFLTAAVQVGKFPPARLQHWKEAWDKDPVGIKAAVNSMPEGLIPVSQLGAAPPDEGDGQPAYPAHWLPEIHRPAPGTISQER
jgi:hypothetical protein